MRQYSLDSGGGCARSDDEFSVMVQRVAGRGGSIPRVATGRIAAASTLSCGGFAAVNCDGQPAWQVLSAVVLLLDAGSWHGAWTAGASAGNAMA